MEDRRCPDCGYRLKNSQCPICLKQVPLRATNRKEINKRVSYTQPQQIEVKKMEEPAQTSANGWVTKKKTKRIKIMPLVISVIVTVLVTFSPNVFKHIDLSGFDTEPAYYEDYIPAGEGEAAEVPQIAPQQVYDKDGLSIRIDGLGLFYGEYAIAMTVTNDTDYDLNVHGNEVSVNTYMMPMTTLFCEVESGKEVRTFLQFDKNDLEEAGITEIAEVAFWMDIYENEDYTRIATTDLITLKTSIADGFVQPVDDSGMEIYVAEDIRLKVKRVEMSDYDYGFATVFIENCSDQTVELMDESICLNGEEIANSFWTIMRPHTQVIENIYMDDLYEMGITAKEQLETLTVKMDVRYEENTTNPRQVLKSVSQTVEIDLAKVMGVNNAN